MQFMKLMGMFNKIDKESLGLLKSSADKYFKLCIDFKLEKKKNNPDYTGIITQLSNIIDVTDLLVVKLGAEGIDFNDFIGDD